MAEMEHIVGVPNSQDCDYLLSPGVRVGDIIFISGMTPRDDEGKMLEGTIEELTEQCLRNLEKVIVHAGGSMKDFAKLTVFLKDLANDYDAVNATFERVLPNPKPARSCFQTAMNPAGARVEIEAIARAPKKA